MSASSYSNMSIFSLNPLTVIRNKELILRYNL